MTSPQLEIVEEVLTPEAQAVRAAAEAREQEKIQAPAMRQVSVESLLPWRDRLKLWWFSVRLKFVGWLNRAVGGIVPVRAAEYHEAMAEFARLFSYMEKSGAMAQQLKFGKRVERGLYRALELLAAGEKLADAKSYRETAIAFARARQASGSRKRAQRRAQAMFAQVRAQTLLSRGRLTLARQREQQHGVAKKPEKKLAKLHARITPIKKVEPPKDTPATT